ncbi:MAG TPA: glycerophosphodiester phosphodiesterase family protein, partial [Candidatus Babeliales bacterium]|nr:glycerophosphodiester phosphodiesterase family protein [Candidatus Babeliales bacterium]
MAGSFWDSSIRPIPIAHRGGGAAFEKEKHRRENTLEAFEQSVALGYQFLEMEVIQTADNEVIVIHVAKNKLEAKLGKKEAPDYTNLQKMTYGQIKSSL